MVTQRRHHLKSPMLAPHKCRVPSAPCRLLQKLLPLMNPVNLVSFRDY